MGRGDPPGGVGEEKAKQLLAYDGDGRPPLPPRWSRPEVPEVQCT